MKKFDLAHTPLSGSNIIEASAGTGKTYAITWLFLRLIVEKHLPVNEILVVTFTEAATEELKGRTRCLLRQALLSLSSSSSENQHLKDYCLNNNPAGITDLLTSAIRSLDQASIFTIHGFCRKMLSENAFESGSLFDTEVVQSQEALIEEVVEDFWRKNFYDATSEFVAYALNKGFDPPFLMGLLGNKMDHADLNVLPQVKLSSYRVQPFQKAFETVRQSWSSAKEEVEKIFYQAGLNRTKYRQAAIPNLMSRMELLLAADTADPSLFEEFKKFTASYLSESMTKNQSPPKHIYFDHCEKLKNEAESLGRAMDDHLLYLKYELFQCAGKELVKRKKRQNIRSFGDLLIDLRDSLLEKGKGPFLARAIRSRYQAALIDEFQDTDPVQWDIFRTVFDGKERPLFLIGDPKQAIYGFRGADVHAYIKASQNVNSQYTLDTNYRSEAGLVTAVNTIFSRHENPFVFQEIRYREVTAHEETDKAPLKINEKTEAFFHLWFVNRKSKMDSRKPVKKDEGNHRISRAVAAEIAKLIKLGKKGQALLGENPLVPEDIAVLARTHREAGLIQSALNEAGVLCVIESTGCLFDSHEAEETQRVLTAFLEPNKTRNIKAALSTDIWGVNGEELEKTGQEEGRWNRVLMDCGHYHKLWVRHDFARMFREFMEKEKVRERLLKFPDGERRVTNLLHIAEVLHQKAVENKWGTSGLLAWLSEQRNPESPVREKEHEMRLESDENAVKIITIHKSKGLEFPVVFCPFMGSKSESGKGGKGKNFLFHDEQGRVTVDLGSPKREERRKLADVESLAENLRLLYVGLTRAKNRCYLAWGPVSGSETSAPAYLFHSRLSPQEFLNDPGPIKEMTDEEYLKDLDRFVEESQGTIRLSPLPDEPANPVEPPREETESFQCRILSRSVWETWRVSSFSSMILNKPNLADFPDRDARTGPEDHGEEETEKKPDIFSFPKGAQAGNFFHDLLENLDFKEEDPSQLVEKKLALYGFDASEWSGVVTRTLRNVLGVSLDPRNPDLALSRVSPKDRIHEMEFHFPMAHVKPDDLGNIFRKYDSAGWDDAFSEEKNGLTFSAARGFMKGFVDMVFSFDGRYYLVDWKSNHLGDRVQDYHQERLKQVMQKEFYVLQYSIYAVALNRYLSLRLPGYDYKAHFGGVYYLFLRGMDPDFGPEFGVFRDCPPREMVEELTRKLAPS